MRLSAPVFAVALLLLARGSSPAFAETDPIPREQLVPTLTREFAGTRHRIRTELKEDPAARDRALDLIDGTERAFLDRVGAYGSEPSYPVEVAYLRGAFEGLVLWKAREASRIMLRTDMDPLRKKEQLAALTGGDPARRRGFEAAFVAAHGAEIEESVAAHRAWRKAERAAGRLAEDPERDSGSVLDDFRRAPLLLLGRASVRAGIGSSTGAPAAPSAAPAQGRASRRRTRGVADDWDDITRAVDREAAPRAITGSAAAAMRLGRYAEAAELARVALEFDPGSPSALAVLNSVTGRADAAAASSSAGFAAAAAAAALSPSAANPGGLPRSASQPAAPSDAIAAAAAADAARRDGERAYAAATAALGLRDAERALVVLDKALAEGPAQPRLYHLRAGIRNSRREWDEAAADADAGLALAPGNLPLLLTKAYAHNRARRYADAFATSDQAVASDPRSAWALAGRAHARAGLGDRAGMLSDIERAAALDPRFKAAVAVASELQLPTDQDILFLFPEEISPDRTRPAAEPRETEGSVAVARAAAGAGAALILGALLALAWTRTKSRPEPAPPVVTRPEEPATGILRGQYEIKRQIGAGGMGTVYEGSDLSLGRRVAIKKLREELRVNARERQRFVAEARTVASLRHPNIVDIYAIVEEGEDVYLVFEFVEGGTVDDELRLRGRLDPAEAARVTSAMGDALTYAHSRGVIHRDMKPSNVMLTADGGVKVMDFGIARASKDALQRYAMTGTIAGTPPYMAPEQEHGAVRSESDVYSLAVCSYEMLTGERPFAGIAAGMLMNKINMSYIPPSRAIAGLPRTLDEVFTTAFQADPDRRYRTPQEFVAALSDAAGAGSKTV